jgi:hypothetical protein
MEDYGKINRPDKKGDHSPTGRIKDESSNKHPLKKPTPEKFLRKKLLKF